MCWTTYELSVIVERTELAKVKHTENNSKKLAEYLVEYIEGTEVTYFCSDIRLDDLPTILKTKQYKS